MLTLSLEDFTPIELTDKGVFKAFYEKFPPLHSDYAFSTMVSWRSYMEYYYADLDGSIVIMTRLKDMVQFRPPLGSPGPELERQIMKLASRESAKTPFGMIDDHTKERLGKNYPGLVFEPHRDFFDYVYRSSDLAEIAGKKYMKIRNLVNRFKKRYRYYVEPISEKNLKEVKQYLTRWCLWKDCDKVPLLKSEKKAIMFSMDHFTDLELNGIVIKIDGDIEALSIYETLRPDTAVIHFEKAIPDFDGLYQAINQETAKILVNDFEFINRESDMGFPGLRRAKTKYHPHHMVEIYHINKEYLKF